MMTRYYCCCYIYLFYFLSNFQATPPVHPGSPNIDKKLHWTVTPDCCNVQQSSPKTKKKAAPILNLTKYHRFWLCGGFRVSLRAKKKIL